jgi:hypothetical protein
MEAKPITNMVVVRAIRVLDAEFIAEVDCNDFDEYKSLPSVIEVQGKYLGKTGWSSDRNYACYKENVSLGIKIDIYV